MEAMLDAKVRYEETQTLHHLLSLVIDCFICLYGNLTSGMGILRIFFSVLPIFRISADFCSFEL